MVQAQLPTFKSVAEWSWKIECEAETTIKSVFSMVVIEQSSEQPYFQWHVP